MHLLVYTKDSPKGKRLMNIVQAVSPDFFIATCEHPAMLHQHLVENAGRIDLLVMMAENRSELSGFMREKECLQDLSLVLILPDEAAETVSEGLKLYPRYVGFVADDPFTDLGEILKKMLWFLRNRK